MYLSSRNVSSKMHCIHYKNTKAFCSCFDENYCAPTVAYIHTQFCSGVTASHTASTFFEFRNWTHAVNQVYFQAFNKKKIGKFDRVSARQHFYYQTITETCKINIFSQKFANIFLILVLQCLRPCAKLKATYK